jgi:hypothetical protein
MILFIGICFVIDSRYQVQTNKLVRRIDQDLYVCMCVCIRVGHKAGPCTATFNDLLCFPFQLPLY